MKNNIEGVSMNEYRLEEHLKECSEKYPRYENLYATWNLNKETCINAT